MKRCLFLTSIIWIIQSPLVQSTINVDRYKGLKFAGDANSYLLFTVDMSPFVNGITVCGWLKNLRHGSATWPTAFNYGNNDVRLQGNGDNICIRNNYLRLKSRVSVPRHAWTHTCMSWSSHSGTIRFYINGRLIGDKNIGSSSIPTGHQITIGNHNHDLSDHMFGGEMVNLNVYAKQLSGEEIKWLSDAGVCSTAVDENEDFRLLKWEDILKKPRSGTVTEIDIGESDTCKFSFFGTITILARLEEAVQKVHKTTEQLSESQKTSEVCQQTLEESQQALEESQQELEESQQALEESQQELEESQQELEESQQELEVSQQALEESQQALEASQVTAEKGQQALEAALAEKQEIKNTLNETNWRLNKTELELHEVTINSNKTAEELFESQKTLETCQQALEVALAEKEDMKETLNETELELHEVTVNLNRTAGDLETALEQLEDYNKTSGWYWDLFFSDKYINTTISPDVSEQIHSSWDDIADLMTGVTVTDQFISFWKRIDRLADQRPWSVFYSERYLNKVFTSEKAESLKTMWDQIGDKLVGVTMTKETVELLKFVSCRDNCEAPQ